MAAEMKVKWIWPKGDGTYAITTQDGCHLPRVGLSPIQLAATATDFVVESNGSWTLDLDVPDLPSRLVDCERDAEGVIVELGS